MKRIKAIVVALSLAFVAALFAVSCFEGGEPQFSHKKHVAEQKLTCDNCHAGSEDGVKAGAPTVDTCSTCHDQAKTYAAEAKKLANEWPRLKALPADGNFSHKTHVDNGVKCENCHGDMGNSKKVTQANLPTEATCIACHKAKGVSTDCSTCHKTISKTVAPPSHKQNWERFHGEDARDAVMGARCERCHAKGDCDTCHKVEKPIDHNGQWREFSHGAEVRMDSNRCATCHRTDFCVTCHRETQPRSHNASWKGPEGGRHCVECHVPADDNCVVCHGAGAPHLDAPPRPAGPVHATATDCRGCHTGFLLKHPDNGVNCLSCHR